MDMKNKEQIPKILALVSALVQHGETLTNRVIVTNIAKDKLRKFMKPGTAVIARLIEDEHHECWNGSVNASIILSHCGTLMYFKGLNSWQCS
jgi:hypothetical protein